MTVIEVINAAAVELGLDSDVQEYLSGISTQGKQDAEALLRCYNNVENELALDYLPLYAEEELETETGVIRYGELSKPVVRILKVTDAWGNDSAFKLFPEYLKTQAGRVLVRYAYTPTEKSFGDECEFHTLVSLRLFVYGVVAEFCLLGGRYEESAVWDRKYKEAIACAYRSRPAKQLRARRWV